MYKKRSLLTIEQLLRVTNARQLELWGPERAEPITERTFRYWVQEGLVPRRGSRGPSSKYPAELTMRLLFIRSLQKDSAFTLRQIRLALGTHSASDIERVVTSNETVELPNERISARYSEVTALESFSEMPFHAIASRKRLPDPPANSGLRTLYAGEDFKAERSRLIDHLEQQERDHAELHKSFNELEKRLEKSQESERLSRELVNRVGTLEEDVRHQMNELEARLAELVAELKERKK